MAIGTTPLFSKLSGSAGPVDFRTRRNGKIEIGKKRIPANPQSTRQLEVRNAYGRLSEIWHNETWVNKEQYADIAKSQDIDQWNAWQQVHIPSMNYTPGAYMGQVEGTGNTLHDLSPNNNHGTISGATWEQHTSGVWGLKYDGIDDFTNCGADNSLLPTAATTLIAWCRPITAPLYHQIITNGYTHLVGGTRVGYIGGRLRGYWQDTVTGLQYIQAATNPELNTFSHIAFVAGDNGKTKLYINKILQPDQKPFNGIVRQANNTYIGALDATQQYYHGNICLPFLLPHPLTQSDINRHFDATEHLFRT